MTRRELWSELAACRSNWEGPWVVCGDFIVTRFVAERVNCHKLSGAMTEFSETINELELVDPPLFGGSYTSRGGGGIIPVPPGLIDSYTQPTGRTLSYCSSSLCYLE